MDWKAAWIWHPTKDQMDNFYLHARKALDLSRVPDEPVILVTASSLYQLYVNGRMIGRGPNPTDPSRYYYDTYDVAEHLREGENVIAALCYNYGEESRGVLNQNWGRGGLLLELRAGGPDGETLAATDNSWHVLQSPAWRQDAPVNCTLYGDFKEVYDSRAEPEGWAEPGFDDGNWLAPEVLGTPPVEPWTNLIPREMPFLSDERVRPVNAFWESASVTYSWRDDWEVYRERNLAVDAPGRREGETTRVFKTHDDFSPSIILDFGRDVTGYVDIVIADSAGGVVDVLYGEDLYLTRVDSFILRGGRQVLRPYNRRTFRYCKLLFRETPEQIEIEEVSCALATYPVERRGAFSCSDELLNRIWEVGRYTIRISMLDHYVDCPWRERTMYGGDMYGENLIAHYAFGDPRMTRKCLRQMAHLQYPEGALPPWGPYSGCHGFYPAWSAFWALCLLDHYELSGDRDLLQELWPNLKALLEWTITEAQNECGLIRRPVRAPRQEREAPEPSSGYRHWMESERGRCTIWDNVAFLPLLRRTGELARALGRADEAERYLAACEAMAGAMQERFLDPETGLYADEADGEGARRPGFTGYHNALMLWTGALDSASARRVIERVFTPQVQSIGGPFAALFMTEALFRYGEDGAALDFIRAYWGEMLNRGATTFWEDHFSLDWAPGVVPERGTSRCHGWSAGPTYSLPAHVLGVRPLTPGFEQVLVHPQPGDLDWAAGEVPTPHGPVRVSWSRSADEFRMELDVPPGTTARVVLPPVTMHGAAVYVDGRTVESEAEGAGQAVTVGDGRHEVALKAR